jgi:hypothetical protein
MGRPRTTDGTTRRVYLSDAEDELLLQLGNGVRSHGVRVLIDEYMQRHGELSDPLGREWEKLDNETA